MERLHVSMIVISERKTNISLPRPPLHMGLTTLLAI